MAYVWLAMAPAPPGPRRRARSWSWPAGALQVRLAIFRQPSVRSTPAVPGVLPLQFAGFPDDASSVGLLRRFPVAFVMLVLASVLVLVTVSGGSPLAPGAGLFPTGSGRAAARQAAQGSSRAAARGGPATSTTGSSTHRSASARSVADGAGPVAHAPAQVVTSANPGAGTPTTATTTDTPAASTTSIAGSPTAGTASGTGAAPADPAAIAAVPGEASFIESAQIADGAITEYPGSSVVNPYLGAYAAMGLARASMLTGDPTPAADAWRWLDWYQGAEGSGGIVTDATATGGTTVPTGTVDATDATAGMFLVAADNAWAATGDVSQLRAIQPGIAGALTAIASVRSPSGLTWATASYRASYLMDESEVYGGLVSAAALETTLGDQALATQASSEATALASAVAGLWDPATGAYDWAVAGDGVGTVTNWQVAYPDAFEQAWAVAWGLAPASRASALMGGVAQDAPAWSDPTGTGVFDTNGADAGATMGYWPVVAWGFERVGNTDAAVSGTAQIRAVASAGGDAWPYTPAIAGQLVVAAAGGVPVPSR